VPGGPWYVYMIECANRALYTGVTTDVDRRFAEHSKGGARYTAYNRPLRVVYREDVPDRSAALKREAQIRRLDRTGKLRLAASAGAIR